MWSHQHHVVDTLDVNEHAASLSMWDQHYEQVSAGRFNGHIEELSLGPAHVFRERTLQSVLQQGMPRPGTMTIAVPLHSEHDSWFCGRRLRRGQAFGVLADREFELATRGEFDVVALSIEREHLDEHSRRIDGLSLAEAGLESEVLCGNEDDNAALLELLVSALASSQSDSGLLGQPAMQRALVHALSDLLLARLRSTLATPAPTQPTAATRLRVVRQAREYMREHVSEAIGVPELCTVLGVSRRTLQYSFQEVLDLSPVTYLRTLRLNGVRRALLRGGRDAVADHAARWGFWHLSRFATDYRAMFGERPSETLQRARAASGGTIQIRQ